MRSDGHGRARHSTRAEVDEALLLRKELRGYLARAQARREAKEDDRVMVAREEHPIFN